MVRRLFMEKCKLYWDVIGKAFEIKMGPERVADLEKKVIDFVWENSNNPCVYSESQIYQLVDMVICYAQEITEDCTNPDRLLQEINVDVFENNDAEGHI